MALPGSPEFVRMLGQKTTEQKIASAYAEGAKAGLEIAIDDFEITLRKALAHDHASLSLTFNALSGAAKLTVDEFFASAKGSPFFEFAATDLAEARRANSWWRISWSPTGSSTHNTVSASTLGGVLERYTQRERQRNAR